MALFPNADATDVSSDSPDHNSDAGGEPIPPAPGTFLAVEIDSRVPGHAWTAPSSWTRIDGTNALRSIHVRRGLPDENARTADPGECVLVFDNNNGYLDTGFSASPYASLLTPGRQLRVTHTKATGAVDELIRVVVDDWPLTILGDGFDAAVEVVAVDTLGLLGTSLLPPSVAEYELKRGVRYPRPLSMFPLRETVPGPDVGYASETSDYVATPTRAPRSGGSELVPYSGIAGLRAETLLEAVTVPADAMPDSEPWTVAAVVAVPEGRRLASAWSNAFGHFGLDQVPGGSTARARVTLTDDTVVSINGGVINDGAAHLIAMRLSATTLRLYVDGTMVASAAISAPPKVGTTPILLVQGDGCEQALTMVWNTGVIAETQALIVADLLRPWNGQTATQRLGALLDVVTPGGPRSGPNSSFVMQPATLKSKPSLDVIRRTVEGADGKFWCSRSNVIRFELRGVGDPPAAVRTYGAGGVPVAEMTPVPAAIVTHCIVGNESGSQQAFHDTGATARHGEHRLELDEVPLLDTDDMHHLAERRVHFGSRQRPHVGSFVLRPSKEGVGYDDTLSLELFDRIDIAYERPWAGVVTEKAEVIGIDHDASDAGFYDWTTTVRVRPVRPRRLFLSVPSTGQGASTPDSVANSITGDLDIRGRAGRNWMEGTSGIVVSKPGAYGLHVLSGGRAEFVWVTSGGVEQNLIVRMPRGGSRLIYLRGTLVVGTGLARIWASSDGVDWRILGERTAGATSIADSTAAVEIGIRTTGGVTEFPLIGNVYEAEGRAGIDGAVQWRFAPTEDAPSATATSWTASTGETWTVRSGSALVAW